MNITKFFASAFFTFILALSAFAADRALVIGIDDYKNVKGVQGGIADAKAMELLVQKKFGFPPSSIRALLGSQATMFGIRDSVKNWLIAETKAGDRVFFFYSGHGSRVDDQDGDEQDGKDEVIAPFDVEIKQVGNKPQINNVIRDDEVNEWISALSGRQVVLVFDSCNSGTISRSIEKTQSKFLSLEAVPPSSRGTNEEIRSAQTKDLSTVIDSYMTDKTPNVVVISAAQANQTATWLDTNGSLCNQSSPTANYRGALAYLFEKAFEKGNPTLSQLNTYITDEMIRLQNAKAMCKSSLNEYQKPLLEYNISAANQTLWGMSAALTPSWEQSAITALQNPLSKIDVRLKFDSQGGAYKIGDTINYSVTLGETVYLYVVVFSQQNIATVIYPYSQDKLNFKQAGTYNFDAVAQEPLGKDVWVVIAAKQKLIGLEGLEDNQQFGWQQIFDKIGVNEMQVKLQEIAKSRGVGSPTGKLKGSDWQTSSAVMQTLPK